MDQDRYLMGFVALALVAVFTIYFTAMPAKETQQVTYDPAVLSRIESAAGDVVPGGVDSAKAVTKDAQTEDERSPAAVIYTTEDECKAGTSRPCHYVRCEADTTVAEGTDKIEFNSAATDVVNECKVGESTGWRPVVPTPDNTAVPEVIAPPVIPSQEAPVEE